MTIAFTVFLFGSFVKLVSSKLNILLGGTPNNINKTVRKYLDFAETNEIARPQRITTEIDNHTHLRPLLQG